MYAIDMDGNWQWGKYFSNNSHTVGTISGCYKNSKGKAVLLGLGHFLPVIMEVNPMDGEVEKFMSLEKIGTKYRELVDMPKYFTFGAIYHDLDDPDDGKAYYYASFVLKDTMMILKINSDTLYIKSSFKYHYEDKSNEYKNRKIPGLFLPDRNDDNSMFLFGQF